MPANGSISEMGYVALQTRMLKESVRNATDIYGLSAVDSTDKKTYLSAANTHHEIVYTKSDQDAVDHIGLVAPNRDELDAIREKVRRGGWKILAEQPIEDHIEAGFAFVGPDGFTWHVYLGMEKWDDRPGGFGPDRYGHVNLQTADTVGMRNFLVEIFDFRVSDQIGEDVAFFLRCNIDHHGIAIFKKAKGPGVLHHHAWQTQSIVDLGRLGDRLRKDGRKLLWGPVRHGAGHNIAAYAVEPCGAVIELYTDLEYIYDHDRAAYYWEEADPFWVNQWDGQVPRDIFNFGIPPVDRTK